MSIWRIRGCASTLTCATIVSAILRGGIFACFANPNATGVAKSPCSGVFVGENGIVGTSGIESSPAAIAARIAPCKIA